MQPSESNLKLNFLLSSINTYIFEIVEIVEIMAYSVVNAVFNSAIGDFNVEIKYHTGVSVYKGTYGANHGHIDCGGKMEYNPDNMTVYIANSMTTTELRASSRPGNNTLKMYVVDGVHPEYTILFKITDGPDIAIPLKKLLQDNVHKLVKRVIAHDTCVDYPVKGSSLTWHLASYINTTHLATNGVIEARVTKGQMDFIGRCPNACNLVFVNPDTNYTIVAYISGLGGLISSYVESGKKEKMQEIYNKIVSRMFELNIPNHHGFINPNKEMFNPYSVVNAADNMAPITLPGPNSNDLKFVRLTRDGDFVVVESSAKISQLEFCFETGVPQLTVINNFSLVPNDLIKTTTEDTRKMTVTVDINATQARLLFMTLGQTLINQLSHVKFGVK